MLRMFNKISNVLYTLNAGTAEKLLTKIRTTLDAPDYISDDILLNTINQLVTHEVALLAYNNLKDVIVKSGFVSIVIGCENYKLECSVGIIDNKLVYGVLI